VLLKNNTVLLCYKIMNNLITINASTVDEGFINSIKGFCVLVCLMDVLVQINK